MKTIQGLLWAGVVFLIASAGAPPARGSLLVNGGFETPGVPSPGLVLNPGDLRIVGWTLEGPGILSFNNGNNNGTRPAEGLQHMAFNAGNTGAGFQISQVVATIPGEHYALSFRLGRSGAGGATLALSARISSDTGSLLASWTNTPSSQPGYLAVGPLVFRAVSTVTRLSFLDVSSSTIASDLLLDAVVLEQADSSLLINGGFEFPELTVAALVMGVGDNRLTGWSIEGTGILSVSRGERTGTMPAEGVQQVGFNRGNTGPGLRLTQSFATTPGQEYALRFEIGRASMGGASLALAAYLSSDTGASLGSWTNVPPSQQGYALAGPLMFRATGLRTRVTFVDVSPGTVASDLLLDAVSVVPTNRPVLVNGGFEAPLVAAPGLVLDVGDTRLTGWWLDGTGILSINHGANSGTPPAEGAQHVAFNAGSTGPGFVLAQTFSTAAGQYYAVRFQVGRSKPDGASLALGVRVEAENGPVLLSRTNTPPAQPGYAAAGPYVFQATGPETRLMFINVSPGTAASDLMLDAVSIAPTNISLVVNGGFETPTVDLLGLVLSTGDPSLPGWTIGGMGILSFNRGPNSGTLPTEGLQHVGFNGGNTGAGLQLFQTLSTIPGREYALSFQIGRSGSGTARLALKVEVTSESRLSLGAWTNVPPPHLGYAAAGPFLFQAIDKVTRLTFTDVSPGTIASDLLLDQVAVRPSEGLLAPRILLQSREATAAIGSAATLAVVAIGVAPLTYEWQHDGEVVRGATDSRLEIPSVKAGDAGTYSVRVSNSAAATESEPMVLKVVSGRLSIVGVPAEGFVVVVHGEPNVPYAVQISPDSRTWQTQSVVTNASSVWLYTDSTAPVGSARFYRLLRQ